MAHDTPPSLDELVRAGVQDLRSRVTGLTRVTEQTPEHANTYVAAALSSGNHDRVSSLYAEIFIATCSEQSLAEWGDLLRIPRRPAIFAEGRQVVYGVAGSVLPEGQQIQRDDGTIWATLAEATVPPAAASVVVDVRAADGHAGAIGNFETGEDLSLVGAVAGFTGSADGVLMTLTGLDLEEVEDWRRRILKRFKRPRLGGGAGDFEEVVLANGGTRAWEFPNHFGAGTVLVIFVDDHQTNPIPTPARVAEIEAALHVVFTDTAQITAGAPVERKIDHHIAIQPDTVEVRATVLAELKQFYQDDGDVGETVQLTGISAAIQKAGGLEKSALLVPSVPVVLNTTELPTVGTVSWSAL